MEELIKLVAKQAGLSDDMAQKGVEMVAGFLQGRCRLRLALRSARCWEPYLAQWRKR